MSRVREVGVHVIPLPVKGRIDFSSIVEIRRIIKKDKKDQVPTEWVNVNCF